MIEKRLSIRNKTLYSGVIALNQRYSTMNCMVKNFTAHGAKLSIGNAMTLPEAFDLAIGHKRRSYQARVIWRGIDELGVRFLDQEPMIHAPLDAARELRAVKADNAALRRRIAKLTSD
jgi:hypothetical protein